MAEPGRGHVLPLSLTKTTVQPQGHLAFVPPPVPPSSWEEQGTVPCSSDCRQTARDGIPTGSSSHSTEKWSYLRPWERGTQLPHPTAHAGTLYPGQAPPPRSFCRAGCYLWKSPSASCVQTRPRAQPGAPALQSVASLKSSISSSLTQLCEVKGLGLISQALPPAATPRVWGAPLPLVPGPPGLPLSQCRTCGQDLAGTS